MKYDLSHLTQTTTHLAGPIQDDEALLLYGLIRTMGLKYIVEIGGLEGYSAQNFLRAICGEGKVVTIDPSFKDRFGLLSNKNFCCVKKQAQNVMPEELGIPRIDLLFFDCHKMQSQMDFYHQCATHKLINNNTILVLHDTDIKVVYNDTENPDIVNVSNYHKTRGNTGFYHKSTALAERKMSNKFMAMGYAALHAHADFRDCPSYIENVRHGLTILSKQYKLLT